MQTIPGLTLHESDLSSRLPSSVSLPFALIATVAAVVVLAALLRRAALHRRWAAEAHDVMTRAKALSLRPGVHVIAGRVRTADEQPAIRLRLREQGREWKTKRGTQHRWTEVAREVDARPFEVVTGGGVVRVEPDASVRLVDLLSTVHRPEERVREREAVLEAGEEVYVSGLLRHVATGGGAYRGVDGVSWVMRAPPDGALVCSTDPLTEPHERWSTFYQRAASWSAALLVIVVGSLAVFYYPLAIAGEVVDARIVELRHSTTRGRRGRVTHHYEAVALASLPSGAQVSLHDDVPLGTWQRLDRGDVVPFVVLPGVPSMHQIGPRARVHPQHALLLVALSIVSIFSLAIAHRRRHAWWEQKKVVSEGSGPLEDH